MIKNIFLDIMMHQSYKLLCTETTVSNHPVVFPETSCDAHLSTYLEVRELFHDRKYFYALKTMVLNFLVQQLFIVATNLFKYTS